MINIKILYKKITQSKTNLFIGLSICCLLIVSFLDLFDNNFSFHDILVESHGLVFDLFIFGILLTTYETLSSRQEKIDRYKEEISDYKFWKSEESMYRTRGLIKRLVELNEKELDLSFCYLSTDKSLSQYKDMRNWKFTGATLDESFYMLCDMSNCNFYMAKLQESSFDQVNLTNCNFGATNLLGTEFSSCDLTNCKFENAAVLEHNWLDKLESQKNIGVDILREKYTLSAKTFNNGGTYYNVVQL